MKPSMHLIYGIIIGILICACSGNLNEDTQDKKEGKKEFSTEGIRLSVGGNEELKKLKAEGWAIIDWEINGDNGYNYLHIGR